MALRALSLTLSTSSCAPCTTLSVTNALAVLNRALLPKIQVPNTFDSTCSKLKSFLIQAKHYIRFYIRHFLTKTNKVLWVVAFLTLCLLGYAVTVTAWAHTVLISPGSSGYGRFL
jgi:hypothetical protein